MFQIRGTGQRCCRDCFFGLSKVLKSRTTDKDDLAMIQMFEDELRGIEE